MEGVSKLFWGLVFIFNMTFDASNCVRDGGWFSGSIFYNTLTII